MFLIDIGLALAASLLLTVLLLRFVHEHGPWRKPWPFGLAIFLFAWAGGVWLAPESTSGWLIYWLPFLLVGLLAALLIVAASPRHDLRSPEDVEQFEREGRAVMSSIAIFMWILWATVLGVIAVGYLR
jgi:hypothetical protein